MAEQKPHWPQPSYPGLIAVAQGTGSFSSRSTSLQNLSPGSLFTKLESTTPSPAAYSTVQIGPDAHVELNSDLLYTNHSCDPSLVFDMSKMEVRVVAQRGLKKGDMLTFFYPSTEWEMAREFECACGSVRCLGRIKGAKDMKVEELRRYWLNKHIEELLRKERGQEGEHEAVVQRPPTVQEAIKALEMVICWYETDPEGTAEEYRQLDILMERMRNMQRQQR